MEENNVNMENEEKEDEVSEEELEAAKSVDLRTLGIEPLATPIGDLLRIYREQHAIVQAFTKKVKEGKSDPTDVGNVIKNRMAAVLKSEDENIKKGVGDIRTLGSNVTEQTFSILEEIGTSLLSSTVLLEELENLVSLMKDEVAYHYNTAVQKEKDRLGIKSTPSEDAINARLACVQLRALIENRVNIDTAMKDIPNYVSTAPENLFKTPEPGKRGGFNTEVFPKTPRLDMGDTPTGNVTVTSLQFRWTTLPLEDCPEEEIAPIPNGTPFAVIAHDYISSKGYRVTGKEIERRLKASGWSIGATKDEWHLDFKTGRLYGKLATAE